MKRKLCIAIAGCIMALCLHAETVSVLRFVPVAGEETEVTQSSLRKVVFTRDSIVLVSATDGGAVPMYKYDYRSILFEESTPQETLAPETERQTKAAKFIRNGQLYIMYGGQMYDVQGRKANKE